MWKDFLIALVRYALIWLFGVLVSHDVIKQDFATQLAESGAGAITLVLLAALPIFWSFLKHRFTKYFIHEAHEAPPGESLTTIKARALQKAKISMPH